LAAGLPLPQELPEQGLPLPQELPGLQSWKVRFWSSFVSHFAVLCGPKVGHEGQAVKKIMTAWTLMGMPENALR